MGGSDSYWMTVSGGEEGQNEVLRTVASQVDRRLYLYLGWDSAWYLSIVVKGYAFSSQSYAFFPGFPLLSWLLSSILQNSHLAIVIFSAFIGVAWIPLYQAIIEDHIGKSDGWKATLFYAFFPYVFLFTTVAYSEGLFLFSTLGAYYFFKKKKILFAMLFASVASITRPIGLLILLPILIGVLHTRTHQSSLKRRSILYLSVPFLSFFSWLFYCKIVFNDWFAPFNRTHWNDMYSLYALIFSNIPEQGMQSLYQNLQNWSSYFNRLPWILFLIFPLLPIHALFRKDRELAIYSTVYFLGVLTFGSLVSIPRFISFLFPVWIPLVRKLFNFKHSKLLTCIVCIAFYLVGLFLWSNFLTGRFVA